MLMYGLLYPHLLVTSCAEMSLGYSELFLQVVSAIFRNVVADVFWRGQSSTGSAAGESFVPTYPVLFLLKRLFNSFRTY